MWGKIDFWLAFDQRPSYEQAGAKQTGITRNRPESTEGEAGWKKGEEVHPTQ